MPRVLGVDIPGEKRAEYSLRYVYGIGATRARQVVEEAEIPADLRDQTSSRNAMLMPCMMRIKKSQRKTAPKSAGTKLNPDDATGLR